MVNVTHGIKIKYQLNVYIQCNYFFSQFNKFTNILEVGYHRYIFILNQTPFYLIIFILLVNISNGSFNQPFT